MEDTTVNLLVGIAGIGGTLAAALLTQRAGRRAERERLDREDANRWLPERLRVSRELLALAHAVERDLATAQSFLRDIPQDTPREEWLGGRMNLSEVTAAGVPGVLSGGDHEILFNLARECIERLDTMEQLAAEVAVVGSAAERDAADMLIDASLAALSQVEAYAPLQSAYDGLVVARSGREIYMDAARTSLRVDTGRGTRDGKGSARVAEARRRRAAARPEALPYTRPNPDGDKQSRR